MLTALELQFSTLQDQHAQYTNTGAHSNRNPDGDWKAERNTVSCRSACSVKHNQQSYTDQCQLSVTTLALKPYQRVCNSM